MDHVFESAVYLLLTAAACLLLRWLLAQAGVA